ncbi:hypothetical protein [Niveispirillum fermenti]|uniref:hypothetical protein n=1 Tax=Niveispirillum fermenti TaxID=1233113 RepID=UPI003A8B7068
MPPSSNRPRVTPGIPLGGVVAVLVTAGTIGWALATGDRDGGGWLTGAEQHFARISDHRSLKTEVEVRTTRSADRTEVRATTGHRPHQAVDMAAIGRSVDAALETAAKAATAKADATRGRDPDIRYLDRSSDQDGTNRLTATALAPAGLRLANVKGSVKIKVADAGDQILFTLENSRKRFNLSIRNGVLWITGPGPDSDPAVTLEVSVPRGTPLLVNNFAGDLTVDGDLQAPARLELAEGEMAIGGLESASVRITRSGTVSLGTVQGLAAVRVTGQGDVNIGKAGTAALDLTGPASVRLGVVDNGLSVNVPGPGTIKVGSVSGAVAAAIPGPGTLDIGAGTASSLTAGLTGPGELHFGGTARDPQILLTGPGRVILAGHEGTPNVYHLGKGEVRLAR